MSQHEEMTTLEALEEFGCTRALLNSRVREARRQGIELKARQVGSGALWKAEDLRAFFRAVEARKNARETAVRTPKKPQGRPRALTDTQRLYARQEVAEGRGQKELAAELGVSAATINRIING